MRMLALAGRVVATLVLFLAGSAVALAAPVITSFSPNSGESPGGTVVTIIGSGFQGVATPEVLIGGVPATNVTVVDDGKLTIVTPPYSAPHERKAITVTVDGESYTWPAADYVNSRFGFAYGDPQPGVHFITPTSGPAAGGTTVTITGGWPTGASAVYFGGQFGENGTPATSFTVVDSGTITAVVPPGTGTVDIWVANPLGETNCPCGGGGATEPATFTYIPPPVVTKLTRNGGSVDGGDSVVLTGTGFTDAMAVSFGANPAASFVVDSDTKITAVSPPGTGAVSVKVETPNGTSVTGVPGAGYFFYYGAPAPTIERFEPPNGPAAGHDGVNIYGSGFTGASAVIFGGTPSDNFTVVNDGRIGVEIPPGTGTVDVTIETPGGSVTAPAAFFYAAEPATVSISPNSGPEAGGNVVTLTGSGLAGSFAYVAFGDQYVWDAVVNDDNSLTVTAPPGTGTVSVTVQTRGGLSAGIAYTYLSGPPQDSVNVELVQQQLTGVVSQTSGGALSGAVNKAVAVGLSSGSSMKVTAESAYFAYSPVAGAPDPFAGLIIAPGSGADDASPWSLWLDAQGTGLLPGSDGGQQVNVTAGVGYRFFDGFVAGVMGGQEWFDYESSAPVGTLGGSGRTLGGYLGWQFSDNGLFDAGMAWTALDYEIASGLASGIFAASRRLLTSGVTGDFALGDNFTVSPSARVFAQWEDQEGWTDSLATVHAARSFMSGTASGGVTVSSEWMPADGIEMVPYAGAFADYRVDSGSGSALVGRIKGGLRLTLDGGASISAGGELGGLGAAQGNWSVNAGVRGGF